MTDQLEIRYVPLSTVALWERNPKRHSIGDLAVSIERYGFKMPPRFEPTLNNGQGGIVAGNGRIETLAALHQQGRPAPRGIEARDGEWLVPVLFGVDAASQEIAEAFGIDDNNLGLSGGDFTPFDMARMWDASYTDILAGLAAADALPITVDGDALDALLAGMVAPPTPGDGGDEFDPTTQDGPTRTAVGDLWQIGPHRLLVGDCTDPANVERLMGGERAALIFEDPPYNVSYQDNESIESLKARNRRTDGKIVKNDSMTDEEFDRFLDAHFFTWPLAAGGAYYLCAPPGHTETQFRNALNRVSGCGLRQCIVWVKDRFVFGRQDYHWRHESILYGWEEGAVHYFLDDRTQDTVWEVLRPTASPDHPTQKPIELPMRAIRNSTRLGDVVFDGFAGSGTTLVAAQRLGRAARVCELDPKYADVILRRAEAEGLSCERITE